MHSVVSTVRHVVWRCNETLYRMLDAPKLAHQTRPTVAPFAPLLRALQATCVKVQDTALGALDTGFPPSSQANTSRCPAPASSQYSRTTQHCSYCTVPCGHIDRLDEDGHGASSVLETTFHPSLCTPEQLYIIYSDQPRSIHYSYTPYSLCNSKAVSGPCAYSAGQCGTLPDCFAHPAASRPVVPSRGLEASSACHTHLVHIQSGSSLILPPIFRVSHWLSGSTFQSHSVAESARHVPPVTSSTNHA